MAKSTYKELAVWRNAIELVVSIYDATDRFPRREMFGLSQQLRRAGVSVPSNVAEGYGRRTSRQRYAFLENALGSLYEVETQIEIATRLKFLTLDEGVALMQLVSNVGRPLSALMRYVEKEARDEPRRRN